MSERLSKSIIEKACLDALKKTGLITYDLVVELLAKKYPRESISISKDLIFDTVRSVQKNIQTSITYS